MKLQSFKFRVIIFAILSAIGIGIMVNSTMKNSSVIVSSNKNEEIKKQQLKEKEKEKEKEIKKQQQINQKQENLEKIWKKGYDEFFDKKYKQAIETERQVIKDDPTFYKAYAVEGIALAYSGNFEKGMQQIDQSLKLNPNYGYARFNKALANELYEHYDEAITWYKKDLEVEKFEWSYYGIASIYGRKGDVNNTVKYLKLAIDINPSVKNNAKNEEDFDNVRNHMEFKELIE
ncbi:hypothetical protein G9F73_007485 [Clostridium estertheticum]|uniref:tetratricopeptide repeat protein n=1 Tax=Clostridium estertheticum TaxID=238834 RepID=UPI0013EEAFFC|nr:hypothetical protein [Clostridium estertheticum]MBZ9607656.1 hypothetical protein [Clostridium estertheticum]